MLLILTVTALHLVVVLRSSELERFMRDMALMAKHIQWMNSFRSYDVGKFSAIVWISAGVWVLAVRPVGLCAQDPLVPLSYCSFQHIRDTFWTYDTDAARSPLSSSVGKALPHGPLYPTHAADSACFAALLVLSSSLWVSRSDFILMDMLAFSSLIRAKMKALC